MIDSSATSRRHFLKSSVIRGLADRVKPYKLSDHIDKQLVWMKPAQPA